MTEMCETAEDPNYPVFEVTFGCKNCGDEWEYAYPSRMEVKRNAPSDVRYYNRDCSEFSTTNCDCCGIIICPTCELRKHVTVKDRNPIDDD